MERSDVAGFLPEQEVCVSRAAGKAPRGLDGRPVSALTVGPSGSLNTLPLRAKTAWVQKPLGLGVKCFSVPMRRPLFKQFSQ